MTSSLRLAAILGQVVLLYLGQYSIDGRGVNVRMDHCWNDSDKGKMMYSQKVASPDNCQWSRYQRDLVANTTLYSLL